MFNKERMSVGIFYHVAAGKNWMNVVRDQLTELAAFPKDIHVGFLGSEDDMKTFLNMCHDRQIFPIIEYQSPNFELFEYPTLEILWNYCQTHPNEFVIYLHNKCSFFHDPKDGFCFLWRRYMTWFLFHEFMPLLKSTKTLNFSVAGSLAVYNGDANDFYFAGNFWVARSNYIATLSRPEMSNNDRFFAEHWVYSNIPTNERLKQLLRIDNMLLSTENLNQSIYIWADAHATDQQNDADRISTVAPTAPNIETAATANLTDVSNTGLLVMIVLIVVAVILLGVCYFANRPKIVSGSEPLARLPCLSTMERGLVQWV